MSAIGNDEKALQTTSKASVRAYLTGILVVAVACMPEGLHRSAVELKNVGMEADANLLQIAPLVTLLTALMAIYAPTSAFTHRTAPKLNVITRFCLGLLVPIAYVYVVAGGVTDSIQKVEIKQNSFDGRAARAIEAKVGFPIHWSAGRSGVAIKFARGRTDVRESTLRKVITELGWTVR